MNKSQFAPGLCLALIALAIASTPGCAPGPLDVSSNVVDQVRDRCLLIISSDGTPSTATLLENRIAVTAQHAIRISDDQTKLWSEDHGVVEPKILAVGAPLNILAVDETVYGDRMEFYRDAAHDWVILEFPVNAKNSEHAGHFGTARVGEAQPGDIIFIGGIVLPDSLDRAKPISVSQLERLRNTFIFRLSQGRVIATDDDVLTFKRIAGDEIISGMSGGPIMKMDSESDDLILVGIYLGTVTRAFIFKIELGRSVHSLGEMLPH